MEIESLLGNVCGAFCLTQGYIYNNMLLYIYPCLTPQLAAPSQWWQCLVEVEGCTVGISAGPVYRAVPAVELLRFRYLRLRQTSTAWSAPTESKVLPFSANLTLRTEPPCPTSRTVVGRFAIAG